MKVGAQPFGSACEQESSRLADATSIHFSAKMRHLRLRDLTDWLQPEREINEWHQKRLQAKS